MSLWAGKVLRLRRLSKRRKTEHAPPPADENLPPPPPIPTPRRIVPPPVLRLRKSANVMHAHSGSDSSRWHTADESASTINSNSSSDAAAWGANFWVTIIDPQTQNHFYACPATGECSWDPPAGNFVLPPSNEGEWWELNDESRSPPVPYYYHTRTGETSWTRPTGTFVIPLGIVQTTTLGRRLSRTAHHPATVTPSIDHASEDDGSPKRRTRASSSTLAAPKQSSTSSTRRTTSEYLRPHNPTLPPIPASPYTSLSAVDLAPASAPPEKDVFSSTPVQAQPRTRTISTGASSARRVPRSTGSGYLQGQTEHSLDAAAAGIANNISPPGARGKRTRHSPQDKDKGKAKAGDESESEPVPPVPKPAKSFESTNGIGPGVLSARLSQQSHAPDYPMRELSPPKFTNELSSRELKIGEPIPDPEAAAAMSPIKHDAARPIPVEPVINTKRLSTGDHRMLPRPLAEDILQFQVSDFAKRYFSTHKTGLLFRRRVPVEQLMVWQKQPLTSPLLILNRSLHKDAVLIFKVIQRIMGDRERDRPVGVQVKVSESHLTPISTDPSSSPGRRGSKSNGAKTGGIGGDVLEEERWLLAEGIDHGELRDEIYCQVVKQLTDNPNPESTFRGWQLLCVLLVTFPPSKNFEGYLRSFMLGKVKHTEGRVDVMAKYCLHRLPVIAKKGPRGKPPTAQEITNAADSAFNPSTFGESLGAIMRLQERTYASSKVPIILPFLADGILALGGTKSEGIFRIPGDGDAVSDLRVRIDKGFYNLEGIDDCNVPASLFKLWLRELQEPLIPANMYNACISSAEDPEKVVALVKELPVNNRRVLLFVISFLQLFLPESVSSVTKMTSANLALVMAPNLLRCDSESMAVVFTNARFEHIFVHNLLLHLKCSKTDPDYVPIHGLGAGSNSGMGRASQSRNRVKSYRDSNA
ncbi:Rho GTPase-activating-like protein [Ceratobasidium sp. AG-Ba]|nr:Rho GTPase-activating-like protein [Ceratobasidium sp. AG-Ba]QRW08251.1 Rho GTPase-activating-like protein [Ceratobasidium sp. AG-Ba]